jgi:predicted thioesterase
MNASHPSSTRPADPAADGGPPRPGTVFEFQHVVTPADSAHQLRLQEEDRFPEVLATSRMVGLMEVAAARLMQPCVPDGSLSVGIDVEIRHLAATLIGQTVTVRAEYLGRRGPLYEFQVQAVDRGGIAGQGRHTRAVVALDRFFAGARRRLDAAGSSAQEERPRD